MASFTIDPATITYTLNSLCAGVNINEYVSADMDNAFYRTLCRDLGMEIVRTTALNAGQSNVAWHDWRDFFQYMQGQLGSNFGVLLNTTAMPNPVSQGTSATSITASIDVHSGFAPADHATMYEEWVTSPYNINVIGWEWSNEPENMTDAAVMHPPWFDPAVYGAVGAQERAVDWCTIAHRNVVSTYTSKISALGRTGLTKIVGSEEFGIVSGAAYDYVKAFVLGTITSGAGSNPNSPTSNIGYTDTVAFHDYAGGFGIANYQGLANAYFYDSGADESTWNTETGDPAFSGSSKSKFRSGTRLIRGILDANGGSSVTMLIGEGAGGLFYPGGTQDLTKPNPLIDIAQAISFCQVAGTYKLDSLNCWSMNRSGDVENFILIEDGSSPQNPTSEAGFLPGRKYYAAKDFYFKYMRLYKQQVQVTITSAAGNSPSSASVNAVPRIQICAGLNSDKTKMAIMVTNVDLATAEQANISWGTTTAQGNIVGVSCPVDQGNAALTAITSFGSGATSLTTGSGGAPSLPAGGSFLFEITGDFGSAPPPPSVTSEHLVMGTLGTHRV